MDEKCATAIADERKREEDRKARKGIKTEGEG